MGTIGIVIGGALANAGAMIIAGKVSRNGDEQKRHNIAMETFTKDREKFQKNRMDRLDYINKTLRQKNHASQTFKDLNEAGAEYFYMTGQTLPALKEPRESDYYQKSDKEKDVEISASLPSWAQSDLYATNFYEQHY